MVQWNLLNIKKTRSFIINRKNIEQVISLLKTTTLFTEKLRSPYKLLGQITLPWEKYMLVNETLPNFLQFLKPIGIVGIRKLFRDPAESHSPLCVTTFIGNKCPEKQLEYDLRSQPHAPPAQKIGPINKICN